MQAIQITEYGAPEVLQLVETALPQPGVGQALIRVRAAGVNRPDVLQRRGLYPVPAGASELPGLEIAGEIIAGDLQGSDFRVGDKVCALVQGGGYAEYCVADLVLCLPVPEGWSMLEAASLPETMFTVWSNVMDRASLQAQETVLVHGGSSGIGVAAIQMLKALGHTVLVTAGSAEKCQACLDLGADHAINYKVERFEERVLAITQQRGVDVILDMVAGSYVARDIKCLADDGRIVIIALLGGSKGELDFSQILRRRLQITGSTLRPRDLNFKAQIAQRLRERVWPLLQAKKIKPVIYRSFALADAVIAHQLMEEGEHIGKIMLSVD